MLVPAIAGRDVIENAKSTASRRPDQDSTTREWGNCMAPARQDKKNVTSLTKALITSKIKNLAFVFQVKNCVANKN